MPVNNEMDLYQLHLFDEEEELKKYITRPSQIARIHRVRELYHMAMADPLKKDYDLTSFISKKYNISLVSARKDLDLVHQLLGNLSQATRDYHRYKFITMIEQTFEMAKKNKDTKSMAAAASAYGRYTKLDKDDPGEDIFRKIVPQPFIPTEDPTAAGLPEVPNIRGKIRKLMEKYGSDIEDVQAEIADYDTDKLMPDMPTLEDMGLDPTGIDDDLN